MLYSAISKFKNTEILSADHKFKLFLASFLAEIDALGFINKLNLCQMEKIYMKDHMPLEIMKSCNNKFIHRM
jgi:hypothetical protein